VSDHPFEQPMLLIDRRLVPASGNRTYENINPATEAEGV
jgi:hypothetical protein